MFLVKFLYCYISRLPRGEQRSYLRLPNCSVKACMQHSNISVVFAQRGEEKERFCGLWDLWKWTYSRILHYIWEGSAVSQKAITEDFQTVQVSLFSLGLYSLVLISQPGQVKSWGPFICSYCGVFSGTEITKPVCSNNILCVQTPGTVQGIDMLVCVFSG